MSEVVFYLTSVGKPIVQRDCEMRRGKGSMRDGLDDEVAARVDREIGKQIKLYRVRAKLTQEQLASKLGFSYQQLQKYERGDSSLSISWLLLLADTLQVRASDLFGSSTKLFSNIPTEAAPGLAEAPAPSYIAGPSLTADGEQLAEAFDKIRNPRVRKHLLQLVKILGTSPP